jgi:hypothetical protein
MTLENGLKGIGDIRQPDAIDNAVASVLREPCRKHSAAGGWVYVPCWGQVFSPTGEVKQVADLSPQELQTLLFPDNQS